MMIRDDVQLTQKLADGSHIPVIALGTFKDTTKALSDAVQYALHHGYSHLDLAFVYDNEELIADVLKQCNIPRSKLFITNKLASCHHHKMKEALRDQLTRCGLDYFDLYLIHWPMAFDAGESGDSIPLDHSGFVIPLQCDYVDVWKEMIDSLPSGLVKHIGVSNFNKDQLQRLYDETGRWPSVNQIEVNPYCPEHELVNFCQKNNIVVEAYAPFGANDRPWKKTTDPVLLEDPTLSEICKQLNSDPHQCPSANEPWNNAKLIIRWLLQRNIVVVIKSVSAKRIDENFSALKLPQLPDWVMQSIDSITIRFRYYQITSFTRHPNYPYEIWDQ